MSTTTSHHEPSTSSSRTRRTWYLALAAAAIAGLIGLAVGTRVSGGSDEAANDVGIDLDAYAQAWGGGDADQLRAFYTDDAVIMPFGHLLESLHDDPNPEYWDVSGPDLDREVQEHAGATLEIVSAQRIGDMVVTTIRWTFPAGFPSVPAGTVIEGTDILHLRDGLIWRQFSDFQVFVNGELIDIES